MRSNNRITKLLIHTDIQLFTLHLIGIYFHLNISLLNIANLEESGAGISHEVGLAALGTAINDSTNIHKPNLCFVAYGRYAHKQGKDE